MKSILLIDNYDSFTYNLVHAFEEVCNHQLTVVKNDEISILAITEYDAIVISPGPGVPAEAGIIKETIATYGGQKPILGVCLGMQAIAEVYGGKLKQLSSVFHGVESEITLSSDNPCPLFKGLDQRFKVGRYHSWAVDEDFFPEGLRITSRDQSGEIMSLNHSKHQIYGVQYHPESILTQVGNRILQNFTNLL